MRKFKVKCPEDLCRDLERLNYELSMENMVIDRFLDRHLNDSSALDSPIFTKYMKSVAEKNTEYEKLKDYVTNSVLAELKDHDADWALDFTTGEFDITVRCDCEIPWLEG